MLETVYRKTLRDLRRPLLGWSIGVVVLVLAMSSLWPTVRDMPALDEFLANYPEAMRELFSIEELTTGAGYLNAELFSILLPALFIVFAVGRGARLIAGEEEAGTLEVLLVTPVSRRRVLVEKAAALTVAVAALGLVLTVATALGSLLFEMDVDIVQAAAGASAVTLLGLEHGIVALAVGAMTGRRSTAVGVASTVAVAGYVLYVTSALVDAVSAWQPLSPFHHALSDGPVGGGFEALFLWMVLVAVVALAVAVPRFDRRDVYAH